MQRRPLGGWLLLFVVWQSLSCYVGTMGLLSRLVFRSDQLALPGEFLLSYFSVVAILIGLVLTFLRLPAARPLWIFYLLATAGISALMNLRRPGFTIVTIAWNLAWAGYWLLSTRVHESLGLPVIGAQHPSAVHPSPVHVEPGNWLALTAVTLSLIAFLVAMLSGLPWGATYAIGASVVFILTLATARILLQ